LAKVAAQFSADTFVVKIATFAKPQTVVAYFMIQLTLHQNRKVFWFDYEKFDVDKLPTKDWVCLAISNFNNDNSKFIEFVTYSIDKGIVEFKSTGKFGDKLHNIFDRIMVDIEISKGIDCINIMTTGSNDELLEDSLWQCFFATCLPNETDFDNISIVCMDLDGVDRKIELLDIIKRFDQGWIPA
jgi:hypothetical protein